MGSLYLSQGSGSKCHFGSHGPCQKVRVPIHRSQDSTGKDSKRPDNHSVGFYRPAECSTNDKAKHSIRVIRQCKHYGGSASIIRPSDNPPQGYSFHKLLQYTCLLL